MGRRRRASKSRGSSSRCGLIKNASVRRTARQFRYLDRFVHNVIIDSDDYTLPRVDLALIAEGCVGDLSLEISTLYGSDDAAHILDLVEVRVGFLLALLGKRLEEIASAHRVHGIRNAGLVGDYLLRAQRQHGGLLARQR